MIRKILILLLFAHSTTQALDRVTEIAVAVITGAVAGVGATKLGDYLTSKPALKEESQSNKKQDNTNYWNMYCHVINPQAKSIIGREEETQRLKEALLGSTKRNVLLVGDHGVGKTAIIEKFAQEDPNSAVYTLDMRTLTRNVTDSSEREKVLQQIFIQGQKFEKPTILVIEDSHQPIELSTCIDSESYSDNFRCIYTTTDPKYKNNEEVTNISSQLEQVIVKEPTKEISLAILRSLKSTLEEVYIVHIPDLTLQTAVDESEKIINKYFPLKAIDLIKNAAKIIDQEPEIISAIKEKIQLLEIEIKAKKSDSPESDKEIMRDIELLKTQLQQATETWNIQNTKRKEIRSATKEMLKISKKLNDPKMPAKELFELRKKYDELTREKIKNLNEINTQEATVTVQHVTKIISRNKEDSKEKEKNIADITSPKITIKSSNIISAIEKEVFGQENAITVLKGILTQYQAGLHDKEKPISSCLFVGQANVGKKRLVESLAVSSGAHLIHMDMAQYTEVHQLRHFTNELTSELHNKQKRLNQNSPFSIILLDKIDKADRTILNSLLTALRTGKLANQLTGESIDLTHTIIIMTSNVGSKALSNTWGINSTHEQSLKNELQVALTPQLFHQIDQTIYFNALNSSAIKSIAVEQIKQLQKRMQDRGIDVIISDETRYFIADLCLKQEQKEKSGVLSIKKTIEHYLIKNMSKIIYNNAKVQKIKITNNRSEIIIEKLGDNNYYSFDKISMSIPQEELPSTIPKKIPLPANNNVSMPFVPIEEVLSQHTTTSIEEILNKNIPGQQDAMKQISEKIMILKHRFDETDYKKPLGAFLFLGSTDTDELEPFSSPTDMDKTATTQALAEILFSDKMKIVRIDLSQYTNETLVNQLIASPTNLYTFVTNPEMSGPGGTLTQAIKNQPDSVILFDNIDNAHPKALDLILKILESGKIIDGDKNIINFANTFIVMAARNNTPPLLQKAQINTIHFSPLTKETIKTIVQSCMSSTESNLKSRCKIQLTISDDVVDFFIDIASQQANYGIRRSVKNSIETFVSTPIKKFMNKYGNSEEIKITLHNNKILLTARGNDEYNIEIDIIKSKIKNSLSDAEIALRKRLAALDKRSIIQILKDNIKGQDHAIESITQKILLLKAEMNDSKKPIASFLCLGPTGVGKTEFAKAIAKLLFDSDNILRFDMSEYMEKHTQSRLIGSPPGYLGYQDGGQLTEAVRKKPFSVILFDEVEKAHSDIFNTLLQLLDEGRLTDGKGQTADFTNTIIIMTSNIGSQTILRGGNFADIKKELSSFFRPEFLNRVDQTIFFNRLNNQTLQTIVKKQLNELKNSVLEKKEIIIDFSDDVIDFILTLGLKEPWNGARPIKRAVEEHISNLITTCVLNHKNIAAIHIEIVNNELSARIDYK